MGVIERVSDKPYIVLPLSVVISRKPRLVVDASRDLNPFVLDRKVKLTTLQKENEGVAVALDGVRTGPSHPREVVGKEASQCAGQSV